MKTVGMLTKMDQAERLVMAASALCGYPLEEEWELLGRCLERAGYGFDAAVREFVMIHIGDLAPLEGMSLRGWDRCRELLMLRQWGATPHPSSGLRETPDATFPSRGRQRERRSDQGIAPYEADGEAETA